MENSVFMPLFITFIAGMSTLVGAALTFIIKRNDVKLLALGMSFSAGVMIYLCFMDVMPLAVKFAASEAEEATKSVAAHRAHGVLSLFPEEIYEN